MLEYIFFFFYSLIYDIENKNKFYYLSLIKEDNDTWSIHGLWPQYDNNKYPTFCKKVNFSYEKLEPIISELKMFWYSNKGKNDDFWKHEWQKHGSCMFIPMNEFSYFNKTLELYKQALKLDLP